MAVGFPIAGRKDPALDELVGFFVNTLVLRVDIGGDPSMAELLDRVRARSLEAFEHQDVPFEVLVERLNPTRSLAHHPLVQVMLAWQNFAGRGDQQSAGQALGDVAVTPLPVDTRTAQMDLTLSLGERWGEAGEPPAFSGSGVPHRRVRRRNHRDPGRAIAAGAGGDDRRPHQATLGGGRARCRRASPPGSTRSPRGVEPAGQRGGVGASKVRRSGCPHPGRGGDQVRRPLDELSRARRRSKPVGAQSDSSWRGTGCMCSAAVASFRRRGGGDAGGAQNRAAYLPIDPAIPATRIEFMLTDAAAVAAITTAGLAGRLDGHAVVVIDVDDPEFRTTRTPPACPRPRRRRLPHLHLGHHRSSQGRGGHAPQHHPAAGFIGCGPAAPGVWSHSHSLAFDVSVWEIFGALLRGGRLVVVPTATAQSPDDLHNLLVAEQVEVLTTTPQRCGCSRRTGWNRWRWCWPGSLPGRRRRSMGSREADGQRLRPDRNNDVCRDQRAADPGSGHRRSARRWPVRRCSCWTARCARCHQAWSASCTWRARGWHTDTCDGPR
ncbi:condensation domain protein [Mycobacterium xenopi 3993]|nr:condensation domain protein [Mycobacterium xenopi 3993]